MIQGGEYVAVFFKKMTIISLVIYVENTKEGFVKILTKAKTILVPPIEPGRRHQV